MRREEDEQLWDLLGHSAEPNVSPFFARNVVRKMREARGESTPRPWWNLRWLVPAAGVAVAIIAAVSLRFQVPDRNHSNPRADVVALADAQDADLITDLDDLVASDDSNSLEDGVLL
jgi:anti-sigma-K factor RskA